MTVVMVHVADTLRMNSHQLRHIIIVLTDLQMQW